MDNHQLLSQYFNIEATIIKKLNGYENLNYKVSTKQGKTWVLKRYIYDPILHRNLLAEVEIQQLLSAKNNDLYPIPQKSITGDYILLIKDEDGEQLYRVQTYLEGTFMIDLPTPTLELFCDFGRFLARTDKALLGLRNVTLEARKSPWDQQYFLLNEHLIPYIEDASKQKWVSYYFLQFKEIVLPELHKLRHSIIHGDANDCNVLVNEKNEFRIIDFGDLAYTQLIQEVAVAAAYAILGKEKPLKWATQIVKGFHEILPLEEKELELLYYLIATRLCTSLVNSSYEISKDPNNKYLTINAKPAWIILRKWIAISPIHATNEFKRVANFPLSNTIDLEKDLKIRHQHFSNALSISFNEPIKMERAAFQYMYDAAGKTYLDAYNNIMQVGHEHPKIVAAGQRQMAKLNTNTRYIYDSMNEYAERLIGTFPKPLNKIFFVNSGSAASDLAIRLAMMHTKQDKVMVMEHGYHGHTRLGIDISHYKYAGKGGGGKANYILKAPIPKVYGSPYKDEKATAKAYADQAIQLLEETGSVAAFISETIVGCGGQIPLAEGYLQQLYPAIRANGGVCIADEVQTGFGRIGEHFWSFALQNVVPDIVIIGKPMGNGHPMAAVITTDEIAASFENGMEFFSSFGGNPVSCAIGLAVLDVLEEEQLQAHALEVGNYLKNCFKTLMSDYDCIGDVRGYGLFLGIELVKDQTTFEPHTQLAKAVKNGMKEMGILIGTDGPFDNVLKIKPPLCFDKTNADELIEALIKNLQFLTS